jgi:hypothetical protein
MAKRSGKGEHIKAAHQNMIADPCHCARAICLALRHLGAGEQPNG